MNFQQLRRDFGVPAAPGGLVEWYATEPPLVGEIISHREGKRIIVKFFDRVRDLHPTFLINYLEPGR